MSYKKLLDKGRDFNNEGKFEDAISIFESIREEGKNDIKWYYRYGFALMYSNRFKEAIELLEKRVLAVDDLYPFGYLLLGQLYYWKGNKLDAFKMVEKGMKICKKYEPESVWEFEQVLQDIYVGRPFANPENWRDCVLSNDFDNYDENADIEYKVKDEQAQEEKFQKYFIDENASVIPATLFINARLEPSYRHNYEDKLDYELKMSRIGYVDGGGTLLSDDRRIEGADIHFYIYEDFKDYRQELIKIIESVLTMPKGSHLEFYHAKDDVQRIDMGEYDVLSLGIDGQNLDDEVYEKYDLGDLIEEIEWAFERERKYGQFFSYEITAERSYLIFLGSSFEQMERIVRGAIAGHPLAVNSTIENESDLNLDKEDKKAESVVYGYKHDSAMLLAIKNARLSFKYFWRQLYWEYANSIPSVDFAMVKIPFSQVIDGVEYTEHMWVHGIYFDGDYIYGELGNEPNDLTNVHAGYRVKKKVDEISDWLISCKGKTYGGFTIQLIRSSMSEEERIEHDKAWGLDFGDYNNVMVVIGQEEHPEYLINHPSSLEMEAEARKYFENNLEEISSVGTDGYTMLHREAIAGNMNLAKILLELGVDKSVESPTGKTAYDYATELAWDDLAQILK